MSNQKRTRQRKRKRRAKRQPAPPRRPEVPPELVKGANPPAVSWVGADGLHALLPGARPSVEQLAEMTRVYQEKIRSHPVWAEIVQQLGEEEAERWLAQCQVELG